MKRMAKVTPRAVRWMGHAAGRGHVATYLQGSGSLVAAMGLFAESGELRNDCFVAMARETPSRFDAAYAAAADPESPWFQTLQLQHFIASGQYARAVLAVDSQPEPAALPVLWHRLRTMACRRQDAEALAMLSRQPGCDADQWEEVASVALATSHVALCNAVAAAVAAGDAELDEPSLMQLLYCVEGSVAARAVVAALLPEAQGLVEVAVGRILSRVRLGSTLAGMVQAIEAELARGAVFALRDLAPVIRKVLLWRAVARDRLGAPRESVVEKMVVDGHQAVVSPAGRVLYPELVSSMFQQSGEKMVLFLQAMSSLWHLGYTSWSETVWKDVFRKVGNSRLSDAAGFALWKVAKQRGVLTEFHYGCLLEGQKQTPVAALVRLYTGERAGGLLERVQDAMSSTHTVALSHTTPTSAVLALVAECKPDNYYPDVDKTAVAYIESWEE